MMGTAQSMPSIRPQTIGERRQCRLRRRLREGARRGGADLERKPLLEGRTA